MMYSKPISPGLVPGCQDYFTSTYLNSTCSSPDTSSMETSTTCPPTTRDFDRMYASLSRVDTSALLAENVHLREMLVNHLDLIQQQSETIVSKDRQLKIMQEKNELLMQKLARMERRVRPDSAGPWSDTPDKGEADSPVKKRKVEHQGSSTDLEMSTCDPDRIRVRPSSSVYDATPDCVDDQLTDEFVGESEPSLAEEQWLAVASALGAGVQPALVTDTPEEPLRKVQGRGRKELDKGKKEARGTRRTSSLPAAATPAVKVPKGRRPPGPPLPGELPAPALPPPTPLYCAQTFYVGCTNGNLDDQLTEVPSLQRGVEVPSWREDKTYYTLLGQNKLSLKKSKETPTWRIESTNPCYTMEGTENLEDSTFLKRHEKMEKEEKKRKRWDLQNFREQQQVQKLRARQEKQHSAQSSRKEEQDFNSLLPPLEAATHICVDDKIPVSALGRTVPDLPPSPFSLPWLEEVH